MFSDKIEGIEKLKAVIPEDMQHWYLFGRHLSELHFRSDYDKYGDEIRNRYKAILANSLYGENAYYKIAQQGDIELQYALKKLKIK